MNLARWRFTKPGFCRPIRREPHPVSVIAGAVRAASGRRNRPLGGNKFATHEPVKAYPRCKANSWLASRFSSVVQPLASRAFLFLVAPAELRFDASLTVMRPCRRKTVQTSARVPGKNARQAVVARQNRIITQSGANACWCFFIFKIRLIRVTTIFDKLNQAIEYAGLAGKMAR